MDIRRQGPTSCCQCVHAWAKLCTEAISCLAMKAQNLAAQGHSLWQVCYRFPCHLHSMALSRILCDIIELHLLQRGNSEQQHSVETCQGGPRITRTQVLIKPTSKQKATVEQVNSNAPVYAVPGVRPSVPPFCEIATNLSQLHRISQTRKDYARILHMAMLSKHLLGMISAGLCDQLKCFNLCWKQCCR